MKNIKSVLLLALALPLGAYASSNENHEVETQEESQIDTSGALVESGRWLESVIMEIESNMPDIPLERWFGPDIRDAYKREGLNFIKSTLFTHAWLVTELASVLGEESYFMGCKKLISDFGVREIDDEGMTVCASELISIAGALSMDCAILLMPEEDAVYMPSLETKARVGLTVMIWKMFLAITEQENSAQEEYYEVLPADLSKSLGLGVIASIIEAAVR